MDTDEEPQRVTPFQLQFDKPSPSQIKIAEWNPEKDLLAMVTEDSKVILHRFNWQRLWTISPGKSVTSLCWRPDGKAIAVGLEDGAISLHDVENGNLLRNLKSHNAAVLCLDWVEDGNGLLNKGDGDHVMSYDDRTSRFFPPAPRVPRMSGVISGDPTVIDNSEDSFPDLLNTSHQHYNILCSADKEGDICFSIFGIFPIGKINVHDLSLPLVCDQGAFRILNASIHKVALSVDLCRLIIICFGESSDGDVDYNQKQLSGPQGFHYLVLDTSIFQKRKKELHQVAQQASNIEDLTEVIRMSLSTMHKQWSDAIQVFHEKFRPLSTLIVDHGLDSSDQEEFLSLLGGARTSPALHQFLVSSLGESGLKRVMKVVSNAGKELQLIVLDHIQPAAEIIGFRMGELRGLARWRARYGGIGLDEKLVDSATERVGMLLLQIVRFVQILTSVVQQFSNFFSWLLRCIKILMSETNDPLPQYNSEFVIMFLKFLYDRDPVRLLLDQSAANHTVQVDLNTARRVDELVKLGGFADTDCLHRTLAKEFRYMEQSFKEAFNMPEITVSKEIYCDRLLPLFPIPSSAPSVPRSIPISIAFYWETASDEPSCESSQEKLIDYISFQIPEGSSPELSNSICILRAISNKVDSVGSRYTPVEASLLSVPDDFSCVDLSLYKECQLVLLFNEPAATSDGGGSAHLMMVPSSDLQFLSVGNSMDFWKLNQLKDSKLPLPVGGAKVRSIPHNVIPPVAVSSSRGVACVFASRRRALVYILEEDEEEEEASDMD